MNKQILTLGFLIAILFSSCKKQAITPGNYQTIQPTQQAGGTTYTNGGTTPIGGNTANGLSSALVGCKCVLTTYRNGLSMVTVNDTLTYISSTKYFINSDTTKFTYSVVPSNGNWIITYNLFNPINGLYLSANNFNVSFFSTASVGTTLMLNLTDLFGTNTNDTYQTYFKKI